MSFAISTLAVQRQLCSDTDVSEPLEAVRGLQSPLSGVTSVRGYSGHHFLCLHCWETVTYSVAIASFQPLPVVLTQRYLSFLDLHISQMKAMVLHMAVLASYSASPSDSGSDSASSLLLLESLWATFCWRFEESGQGVSVWLLKTNMLYLLCISCGSCCTKLHCP